MIEFFIHHEDHEEIKLRVFVVIKLFINDKLLYDAGRGLQPRPKCLKTSIAFKTCVTGLQTPSRFSFKLSADK